MLQFYVLLLINIVLYFISDITMDTLFKVCCFNCNGYKGSQAYVDELIKMHDITFLSEHWLCQNEIRLVNEKLSKSSDK